ncbi:VOC family protein [soil metagenome]
MANIVPYIHFANESKKAIKFYKTVFGGDADVQVDAGQVVHLEFRAGNVHFMGSDKADLQRGSGYTLVLNCDSEQQLREFYAKLVVDGEAVYEPSDSGWGAIIAHCTDRFGVTWLLNYDLPKQ